MERTGAGACSGLRLLRRRELRAGLQARHRLTMLSDALSRSDAATPFPWICGFPASPPVVAVPPERDSDVRTTLVVVCGCCRSVSFGVRGGAVRLWCVVGV